MTSTQPGLDAAAILGFDPFHPDFRTDPYRHYRRLAQAGPLQRTPAGLWVTTSYDLCAQVLRDPRFGHRPEGATGFWREGRPGTRSFLTMDPPDHTRLRRLAGKAFTARLIERLRPRIEALVDDLLARLPEHRDGRSGEVDLISAFAYPLPVILISELLGVPPEDRDLFKSWSDVLARGLDPDFVLPAAELAARDRARAEFAGYFRALAERRRAAPRDDLLSALVAVSADGDTLSEDELLATCILLLIAGHETTVNLIGNGMLALLRHPGRLAWLRDRPESVPAAVEELLRYDPPVQLTLRAALEDTDLGGTPIGHGEMVLLLIGAANRDPQVFGSPDRLDFERPVTGHLAFGLGIHFCLGAPLARLEGQIALAGLLRLDLALAMDPPPYRDNLVLRGPAALPVRLG